MQQGEEEDLLITGEEVERNKKQHLHLGRLHGDEEEEGGAARVKEGRVDLNMLRRFGAFLYVIEGQEWRRLDVVWFVLMIG